jgi:hypothetical protein
MQMLLAPERWAAAQVKPLWGLFRCAHALYNAPKHVQYRVETVNLLLMLHSMSLTPLRDPLANKERTRQTCPRECRISGQVTWCHAEICHGVIAVKAMVLE